MLTPRFHLTQDESFVTIIIHAPYINVTETEIHILDNKFHFYSSPYYLRLTLPGSIEDNDEAIGIYDAERRDFIVTAPKCNKGEYFEGLDMITTLLSPRGNTSAEAPKIEVVGGTDPCEEEPDLEWYIEQKVVEEPVVTAADPKYGFANKRQGVFRTLLPELQDVVDLPEPDATAMSQRASLRQKQEDKCFSEGHYLADLMEPEVTTPFLQYMPPWEEMSNTGKKVCLDTEDLEKMKDFTNKEYVMDKHELQSTYLGLVDIIYAYAYNHRTTEGENTVESAWTITKLSSTLSWLQCFSDLHDVVVSCLRRSLCYPLYRHWDLSLKALRDTVHIFMLGKKQILKCLLDIHSLFSDSEPRYILNQLYIEDYCVWIQNASAEKIKSLAEELSKLQPRKRDMGFDLEDLESAALDVQREEEESNDQTEGNDELSCVTSQMSQLSVSEAKCKENEKHNSDSSDSTSDSDDDTDPETSLDSDDLTDSSEEEGQSDRS